MASTGDSAPGDRHQAEQRRGRIGPFGDLRRDRSNDESQDQKGAGAEDELPLAGAPPGSIDGFRMVMSDVYAGGDLAGHGMRRIAERADALLEDRKSVEKGKSVSVRVDIGGCRIIKKK